jgi:hypothetical protein
MARAVMTLTDYSGERTTVTVNSATLNSANFDTEQTAWTTLRTAIQGLTLGNTYSHSLSQVLNVTTLPAPSPLAQRENKWLVTYADTVTGKRYQMEIGTAELDNGHLSPIAIWLICQTQTGKPSKRLSRRSQLPQTPAIPCRW